MAFYWYWMIYFWIYSVVPFANTLSGDKTGLGIYSGSTFTSCFNSLQNPACICRSHPANIRSSTYILSNRVCWSLSPHRKKKLDGNDSIAEFHLYNLLKFVSPNVFAIFDHKMWVSIGPWLHQNVARHSGSQSSHGRMTPWENRHLVPHCRYAIWTQSLHQWHSRKIAGKSFHQGLEHEEQAYQNLGKHLTNPSCPHIAVAPCPRGSAKIGSWRGVAVNFFSVKNTVCPLWFSWCGHHGRQFYLYTDDTLLASQNAWCQPKLRLGVSLDDWRRLVRSFSLKCKRGGNPWKHSVVHMVVFSPYPLMQISSINSSK